MMDQPRKSETVTVEFPNGPREIEPAYWEIEDDFIGPQGRIEGTMKPVFQIEGYKVLETVDGRYIAAATTHLRS